MTMTNSDLISVLSSSFEACTELNARDMVRCEHRVNGLVRSVYFFQQVDQLPSSSELDELQANVIAPSYFLAQDSSRWSHYLVFVTREPATPGLTEDKARIESDKSYARKVVIAKADLKAFLNRSIGPSEGSTSANELQSQWMSTLAAAGLSAIASDDSRTSVIREIKEGGNPQPASDLSASTEKPCAQIPFLTQLTVSRFGDRSLRGTFPFGRVNLIRGKNGAGKTSLLEAIEHFLCGATHRSQGKSEDLIATAEFSDGKPARSYAARDNAYYQTKDLRWYGRTINRGNKLFEGFARYNFLNTDAAVELTKDQDLQDLKSALSKVALGADAARVWNRVLEFEQDIQREIRPLSSKIDTISAKQAHAKARLDTLTASSPQVLARVSSVTANLTGLGWPNSTQGLTLRDAADFLPFNTLRATLQLCPTPPPRSLEVALATKARLERDAQNLTALHDQKRLLQVESETIAHYARECDQLSSRFARLRTYFETSFYSLNQEVSARSEELSALQSSLADDDFAAELQRLADANGWADRTVSDAMSDLLESLRKKEREIAELSVQRLRAEQAAHAQDSLLSEIRALGKRFTELNPHSDHCPLCDTGLGAHELLDRIERSMASPRQSADVGDIVLRLNEASQSRLFTLDQISKLDRVLPPSLANAKISNVLAHLSSARSEVARITSAVDQLKAKVSALATQGLSLVEYNTLLLTCSHDVGPDFSAEGNLVELLAAGDALVQARIEDVSKRTKDLEARQRILQFDVSNSASSFGTGDIQTAMTACVEQRNALAAFLQAFAELPSSVQERTKDDLEGFCQLASATLSELDSISEQVRREQALDQEIKVIREEMARDAAVLERADREASHLRSALKTITHLKEKQSLESGLSSFLHDNLEAIQSIFTRIHVPNELRLSGLAECRLERFGSNKLAELSQISTGQRAALMLSIFFTLNLSLRAGPRMMLIDDPVAHVDDLNALAFLDFLADVAESGTRQIFFATADDRLANLFQRKLSFLGKEFRTIDLGQSRTDSQALN